MKPFDEAAGRMLDELLRTYRVWGRHRTSRDLSTALRKAREAGRAELAAELRSLLSRTGYAHSDTIRLALAELEREQQPAGSER